MKTLTEFTGPQIKVILAKLNEWKTSEKAVIVERLKSEGKTSEELAAPETTTQIDTELQTKISENLAQNFKLEGDKVIWFHNAVTFAQKRPGNVKRVIVVDVVEGQKAPQGYTEKDGKLFFAEYFPEAPKAAKFGRGGRDDARNDRGGRDNKRGGARNNKGGKDGDKNRGPRRPVGDSPAAPSTGIRIATHAHAENPHRERTNHVDFHKKKEEHLAAVRARIEAAKALEPAYDGVHSRILLKPANTGASIAPAIKSGPTPTNAETLN